MAVLSVRAGRARCAAAADNSWSMLTVHVVGGGDAGVCGGREKEGVVTWVVGRPQYLL